MAPSISPDSCSCVARVKARSTSSWAMAWPDTVRQALVRIATLISCRHLLWFAIEKLPSETKIRGPAKYTIYGFFIPKQIRIQLVFGLEQTYTLQHSP